MRYAVFLFLAFAAISAGQSPTMTADTLTHDGPMLRGAGHVRIHVGALEIAGDTGTVNTETDHVEVQGRANVILPGRADKNLIRYSVGAVVTEDAVTVTADGISVKSGILLRARGHVAVRAERSLLEADEFDLFLRIADGEVRGNVLLNGAVPVKPHPVRRLYLPPDIWK